MVLYPKSKQATKICADLLDLCTTTLPTHQTVDFLESATTTTLSHYAVDFRLMATAVTGAMGALLCSLRT